MATTEESARAEGGDARAEGGPVHGGKLVARALADRGVSKLFTLSGGHLFSIYDGCVAEGIDIIDTRHEQAAAWAAEGYAKATRKPGVAALTAGPGRDQRDERDGRGEVQPLAAGGARRPRAGDALGLGLAPGDRPPAVRLAGDQVGRDGQGDRRDAAPRPRARSTPRLRGPTGPTYVDYPLDVVFMEGEGEPEPKPTFAPTEADGVEEAAAALAGAERPVIMAGTGVYWSHGEGELQQLAEELGIPVFLNGMGRGCLPADHDLCFSRARGQGLKEADVAVVVGVPLDFRLGFGNSFGEETKLIWMDESPNELTANRKPDFELVGGIGVTLAALRVAAVSGGASRDRTRSWVESLRSTEDEKRAGEADELADDRAPLHPLRIYGELAQMLDRDAIVIGDGGDFVSYAGRVVNTYEPGCWMDPGPYGCLGAGPGQAIGAKTAFPDRQVVCLLGDGAFGFSGLEFDTMVRHGLPVVGIIGNNGIWALEYHPMRFLYGYEVAASLRPATRYDEVVKALGGHGELVRHPSELQPALERAFASGKPALVNVLTDPEVVYPRKAVLA